MGKTKYSKSFLNDIINTKFDTYNIIHKNINKKYEIDSEINDIIINIIDYDQKHIDDTFYKEWKNKKTSNFKERVYFYVEFSHFASRTRYLKEFNIYPIYICYIKNNKLFEFRFRNSNNIIKAYESIESDASEKQYDNFHTIGQTSGKFSYEHIISDNYDIHPISLKEIQIKYDFIYDKKNKIYLI